MNNNPYKAPDTQARPAFDVGLPDANRVNGNSLAQAVFCVIFVALLATVGCYICHEVATVAYNLYESFTAAASLQLAPEDSTLAFYQQAFFLSGLSTALMAGVTYVAGKLCWGLSGSISLRGPFVCGCLTALLVGLGSVYLGHPKTVGYVGTLVVVIVAATNSGAIAAKRNSTREAAVALKRQLVTCCKPGCNVQFQPHRIRCPVCGMENTA